MRFDSVVIEAFGPFVDRTLTLAPGMTVLFGPNESGKSTWHAALYAALCGMRRARGAPRREDREFAERHRPWDSSNWSVRARIQLDDGRTIDLKQDLADNVDCSATDAHLGRDVSGEIINDGAPDGARWLGLDREAFVAVACVRQAELLFVLDDPECLQEYLQRAAATAGRGDPAALALERLRDFRREHVGQDRANATKPLRVALDAVRDAEAALGAARRLHRDYVALVESADAAAASLREAEDGRRRLVAAVARRNVETLTARLARLQELARRFPDGPPRRSDDEDLAGRVAAALDAWEHRPAPTELEGRTVADIEGDLARLPTAPSGDVEVATEVQRAANERRGAMLALRSHEASPPEATAPPNVGGASAMELRTLIAQLTEPEPTISPEVVQAVEDARARLEATADAGGRLPALAVTVVGVLAALVGAAFEHVTAGVLVGVVLLALAVVLYTRTDGSARARALADLSEAQTRHGLQEQQVVGVRTRREQAERRAGELGLPPDPRELERILGLVEAATRQRTDLDGWTKRRQTLAGALTAAEANLRRALTNRGEATVGNLDDMLSAYELACAERARTAAAAGRRSDLEEQLRSRAKLEEAASQQAERRARAASTVEAVAAECGLSGQDPATLVARLCGWQAERTSRVRKLDEAAAAYAELESILEGQPATVAVERLREAIERERGTAATASADELATVELDDRMDATLAHASNAVAEAAKKANTLRGEVRERARQLPSVPEAEEILEAARVERERVQRLDATLARTAEFLERAEDAVNRDVASVLVDTLDPWIPQVTQGGYVASAVDPETLEVSVHDARGRARVAHLLSQGTAEQIYLLLRVAMAKQLTSGAETCPLILDDVTVQLDRGRTTATLDLLHAISHERQVVLFTQEEEVREWSSVNLASGRDRFEVLERVAVG